MREYLSIVLFRLSTCARDSSRRFAEFSSESTDREGGPQQRNELSISIEKSVTATRRFTLRVHSDKIRLAAEVAKMNIDWYGLLADLPINETCSS